MTEVVSFHPFIKIVNHNVHFYKVIIRNSGASEVRFEAGGNRRRKSYLRRLEDCVLYEDALTVRRTRGGRRRRYARSQYRVQVTGLPPTASWQDLKAHMCEAGDVCYAKVFRGGEGFVEFLRQEGMKCAIETMDNSRFHSHEGEITSIRVKEDTDQRPMSPEVIRDSVE